MSILKTLIAVAAVLPMVASAQVVNPRRSEQHKRIAQGVRSGQLTRHEADKLRAREANIHAHELRDRAMHHGYLTGRERRHLKGRLNRTSGAIYAHKHNASHRP